MFTRDFNRECRSGNHMLSMRDEDGRWCHYCRGTGKVIDADGAEIMCKECEGYGEI
jgi:DnaJ-class molecular chaperone